MAKALGVGGIFFKSPDPKGLVEWYIKYLNIDKQEFTGFTFSPKSMPENSLTVFSPFEQNTDYFDPAEKTFMFNLVVDNLEEALEQVKDGGAKIIGEIQKYEYGSFGWFMDPDGNKVELWQPV